MDATELCASWAITHTLLANCRHFNLGEHRTARAQAPSNGSLKAKNLGTRPRFLVLLTGMLIN
jgi:hypothetical protein